MTDPTAALIAAATAALQSVQEVDLEYDLHAAFTTLTITCRGPGQFNIQIESAAEVDQLRLLTALQALQERNDDNG